MAKYKEKLAVELVEKFRKLESVRGTWESHWQEIAERVIPSYAGTFNPNNTNTPGAKKNQEVYDATASIGLNRFASILDSYLTPRNSTWHRVTASDRNLQKDRQVQLYFEEVNRLLFRYRYAPKANFSSQNQQQFLSLGAFGSGVLFIDQLAKEPGIRYRNINLGEIYFDENHQGIVDEAWRKFRLTARQAYQKWGPNLPEEIGAFVDKDPGKTFTFLHCVYPREEYSKGTITQANMAYVSQYISYDYPSVLSEGGYAVFPYAISRYEQAPGEVYGRSPAMEVLPAIKTLNEQKKIILKQGHRTVDPVLLAHDMETVTGFSLKPGAINFGGIDAQGRRLVQPLEVGNIAVGRDLMNDERTVINDSFLVNLFQILVETPAMTATEVMERTREKGILLAPTLGRQQSEYLGPMIEREVDILSRQVGLDGNPLLPPLPPLLVEARGEYRIEYDSPLSKAQRAEEAVGLMRTLETVLNAVNITQNPEPLDHFNWDTIVPEVAEIQSVPERWLRSQEEIAAIRQGRAQQAQVQQAIQAGPAAAALAKVSQGQP